MFYFFVDPACHAKGALRNSGLTDKETSQKYQNIIGNICAFFSFACHFYVFGTSFITTKLLLQF